MAKNKLTLEDILKYYKAEIIPAEKGKWSGWINSIDLEHKMLVVSLKGFYPEVHMDVHISDCKLILRSIDQLTDEEKKHIAKNFLLVDWSVLEGRTNQITLIHIMSWCEFEKTKDLLDYFREIGVDIDGMFASGKAVKG